MGLKAEDVYGALSEQIESVDRKLDDAIVGIYSPGGSVAFDNLPALSADVLGKVYIVTDDFTTTSDFVEGEGIDYPGGTNVAIVNRGTNASPVYKYDATTGAIVVDDSLSNVSENPVQNKIITAKTQAIELAISQLSASVLSKAPQTEVNEIKLDISNLSSSLLTKASQSEVNEIKLDISNLSASKASKAEVQEIALEIADLSASTIVHAEPAISTYFTKKDYVISAGIYENTPYVFALPDQHFSFCIMKTWFKAVSAETSGYSHVMLRVNDGDFTQERMSAYDDAITVYRDNETGLYMVSISDNHDKYLSFYMELSVIDNR